MSDVVIRERDYDEMRDDIKTIINFIAKQEAKNEDFEKTKQKVEEIEKDYVSKSSLKAWLVFLTTAFTLMGLLGFRTAFFEVYTRTNESNQELQSEMKSIIKEQASVISKFQRRLNTD